MISPNAHNLLSQVRRSNSAFSLIEVTIALGIFVFAMVPIIGLTSSGMKNLRHSMDDTVRADIVRKVVGEVIRSTNYVNPDLAESYYNDEGVETTSPSIFVATKTISDPPALLSTSTDVAKVLTVTVTHFADTNNRTVFSQLLVKTAQ
jgi:uncharacterized protein (TIGR02598 family)